MNHHKIAYLLLYLCLPLSASNEPLTSRTDFKNEDTRSSIAYATVLPKFSNLKLVSTQADGGAEATIVSNLNYGTEFSWGLTNERVHFLLFGEVLNVTLVAPSSRTVTKTLRDSNITLAKGGVGLGIHPGKSKDFYTLLFCSFEQSLFTHGSTTDTSLIYLTRLSIPHVGFKAAFTALRWKIFSLASELNAAMALPTSNAEDNLYWGYSGSGRIIIATEVSEKLKIELAPQFGYSKYYTADSTQNRVDAGVSLGLRVLLD